MVSLRYRFFSILLVVGCLLAFPPPCHAGAAARSTDREEPGLFIARRDFRGIVRREMAERVARTAAGIAAYEQAARMLARHADLHFAADSEASREISLDGLARMLFSARITKIGAQGFPPHLQALVEVRLEGPSPLREALVSALAEREKMELHGRVLMQQRALVARYDVMAADLLDVPSLDQGHREAFTRLAAVVNELAGLEMFAELLAGFDRRWVNPEKSREHLLRAETLAPANPLILNGLAELFLQLDRPLVALEYAGKALNALPDFARAHDTKGAVLLRQRLPLLAAESFSRAVDLAPGNVSYYVHRASAYLILEEEEAMCEDFRRACTLGDCEGLMWTRQNGRCAGGDR